MTPVKSTLIVSRDLQAPDEGSVLASVAVHVVGSINVDHVYLLPYLPTPGETLHAMDYVCSLGGKGANQAIAAARAGAVVRMVGAVGDDADWILVQLAGEGICVAGVARSEGSTGHARIEVDAGGENRIVLHGGANRRLALSAIGTALARASPGDWLLLQNETNLVAETARLGRELGLRVAYSAAPFDAGAVVAALPYVDLLAVNEVECAQLAAHLGCEPDTLAVPLQLVTAGGQGAQLLGRGMRIQVPAWPVEVVDTTGAGDVFLGYLVAAMARGAAEDEAMREASAAAALQVSRRGAAAAIPARAAVLEFLEAAGFRS